MIQANLILIEVYESKNSSYDVLAQYASPMAPEIGDKMYLASVKYKVVGREWMLMPGNAFEVSVTILVDKDDGI